ncbi:MAG TPA: divalent-cation tolerance protein CutA [Acidiferrobacteraceae bacterium]|nr:divalent-cation tolerance protein CutA [Acidiferrobacteraceae bacterium]
MTDTGSQIVITTAPNQASARKLGDTLVEEGLAACVNVLSGVESIYRWQGKINRDSEHILLIKSSQQKYSQIQQRILDLHPYELPEIIAVPIIEGLPAYLDWLNKPE